LEKEGNMPDRVLDINLGEFVVSNANDHGIGRLRGARDDEAVIEYFDTPEDSGIVEATVPVESLQRAKLESHSRVYLRDEISGAWTIATLVWHVRPNARVSFPQGVEKNLSDSQLYVRWSHQMLDPSPLLANRITESAEFALARRRFLDHMSKQKSAACGMPCLLSSAVDLEHHQIEVVRRVLRDPIQRYLLGDEVGLGKTIEAGFLIRQHVYDNPATHKILLIVPKALKQQWVYELRGRFGLRSELEESIKVLDTSDLGNLPAEFRPTMMLIDEAHQAAALYRGEVVDAQRFEKIRELATSAPALLLLTATPLLHNERDYLTMLHLLDPQVYALEDLTGFRARVTKRQEIAEACFTFNSQTPNGFLADAVAKLHQQLPLDPVVVQWAGILQARLDLDADENDVPRNEAIQRLRTHLNEVYKLHRRLLRNRRIGELRAVTPGRAGANRVVYVDPEARSLFAALDAWREHVIASSGFGLDDAAIDLRKKLFGELLSGCFEGGNGIARTIPHWLTSRELSLSEEALLRALRLF
jgi:ATP-dependent helicase HepA